MAATSCVPSADAATLAHPARGAVVLNQDAPELVETKTDPDPLCPEVFDDAAATKIVPSTEEATEAHCWSAEVLRVQVDPELVEIKIGPKEEFWKLAPTTSCVPSAEEAIEDQV